MATTAPPDVPVRSLQDILTALERHPEWRTVLRQQLLGEELLELPAVFAKFAAETTRRLDLLTQELEATNKRLNQVIADVATLKNDVGILKGAHAETKARADIAVIADELNLEYRRIVPGVELRRVARENGADLRDDEIMSFRGQRHHRRDHGRGGRHDLPRGRSVVHRRPPRRRPGAKARGTDATPHEQTLPRSHRQRPQ